MASKESGIDREVVLAFLGVLAMVAGWMFLTHTDIIAARLFGCTTVHPDNLTANGFLCYSATPIDLAKTQIAGMGMGVCGVIAVFFGLVNWTR
jgi:phage shock protein PspC (stress-responsive transcriptional regulator)